MTGNALAPSYGQRVRNALLSGMDYAGRGAALADLYSGGMLSTLAGMVPGNSIENATAARDRALEGVPRDWKAAATEPVNPLVAMAAIPAAAARKADQTVQKGIRAYHGSPHDFDKFSLEHIGKGEGAQAYGHGLYFAESEGVAKSYRDSLSQDGLGVVARGRLRQFDGDVDRTLEYMRGNNRPNEAEALAQIETLKAKGMKPGRMYEVRIDADPEDFLDWDKPLSQQSERVRSAIEAARAEAQAKGIGPYWQQMKGADTRFRINPEADPKGAKAYSELKPYFDEGSSRLDGRGVTDALRDKGVAGIRYLDAGSRNVGDGSRNLVLFRDDIINIVRKYGVAAAASMFGMEAVMQATAPQNALMQEQDG
jgi:hypothetical protein